eukprot:TRINITY_DN546_c0_g1_i1.p2 TRINITY_DN546_c0_g1~~TRINITY_DN546_c0_g1_i1.p2  ORF type:complete len:135 (-),score=32.35 TRINITY_DN546_c0_g1_i1:36-440(-)
MCIRDRYQRRVRDHRTTMALTLDQVFKHIEENIKADKTLVKRINGVFQFNLTDGGKTETWSVHLKEAPGKVTNAKADNPDVTITIKKDDFFAMVDGSLNGQQAFMQGKLRIGGNMAYAMKLGQLFEGGRKKANL